MATILKQLIEGNLDVGIIKKYLSGDKSEHQSSDGNLDKLDFKTTEFIPYFLNYIREESSCHFTSDLPVISPKKIKKKRRVPRHHTSTSDVSNDSTKSSARGSLFSTPPSGRRDNITMSPIERGQARNIKGSPNDTASPVANQQSGKSSSGNERNRILHVTSTPIKFNLDEDFPPVGSQTISARKSSTPTRRITPTPARTRKNSDLFNSFTFDNSFQSDRSLSTEKVKQQHKRNSASPKNTRRNTPAVKLKLEDFMQQGPRSRKPPQSCEIMNDDKHHSSDCSYQLNADCSLTRDSGDKDKSLSVVDSIDGGGTVSFLNRSIERTIAKKELVTECNVLTHLAEIHSFCILENLVPNIVVEMCFILQLLTVEGKSEEENDHSSLGYLKSVHNCVFYAVLVLEKLFRIIKLLDKGTLRLLLDNTRIPEFSKTFNEELKEIYPTISIDKVPYSLLKSPLNSVPFQASIDNRNNFSTDQAFHCFKRQRDAFYEIVREWEEQCNKPGWSLEEKLGDRIRYVVNQKPGLSNHAHFARLFQSQLIQMCCYENILPTFNEGESPEFIGNLFKSNPEKFFRLQQRLVAPHSSTTGPCPSPGFTETEEFFREFIVAAMSPSFNRYLMDSFIVKINQLNSMSLDESLDEAAEGGSKLQVKFASCLITLRTLAKFLGFLVFSPYHNSTHYPTAVKDTLISTRNQIAQQVDIMFYLKKARDEQRLVLTLPWVIEYLSMMDEISSFLEYYDQVFAFLHHMYRTTLPQCSSRNISRSVLMLSVSLGWLFENSVIPETIFANFSEKSSDKDLQINFSPIWDKMDLVDQHLLYTCCPYLGEFRSILAEAVLGKTKKRGHMKKIKPISADVVEASPSSLSLLQTQLEDNFFRHQPDCLKKDVDFITTRIYENMVHLVKNNLIVSELEQAKKSIINENTFDVKNWREIKKEEFKDKHKVLIMKLCNKTADGVLERISSEVKKECQSRSFIAVQSLTPHDMNEIVIKTASGIVHQSATNKLMKWSDQCLLSTIEKVVHKDMDKIITKEQNLTTNTHRIHAEDVDHPFNWFYQQLLDKEAEKEKTQSHVEKRDESQGKVSAE